MTDTYILGDDGKTPIPVHFLTWASWFEHANRCLGGSDIGGQNVSTVFLGLDHNFARKGPPILWETMIFGRWWGRGEYQERHASWDAAVAGHERAMRRALWPAYFGPLHQAAMWLDDLRWTWRWRLALIVVKVFKAMARVKLELKIAKNRVRWRLKGAADAIRRWKI